MLSPVLTDRIGIYRSKQVVLPNTRIEAIDELFDLFFAGRLGVEGPWKRHS